LNSWTSTGILFLVLLLGSAFLSEQGRPLSLATTRTPRLSVGDVSFNCPMFHCDRQRTGWNPTETVLTPATVSGGTFGKLWQTTLDTVRIGEIDYDPHLYASPLYVDDLLVTNGGSYDSLHFSAIIAATSNGYVYAISAFDANGVTAGTILWGTF